MISDFWKKNDERLIELWPTHSAEQIATELGAVSRHAVRGRASRLNLPEKASRGADRHTKDHRPSNKRNQGAISIKARRKLPFLATEDVPFNHPGPPVHARPMYAPPLPIPTSDTDIPQTQRRTIFDLTNETCRWPIGDPHQPGFFFCGHPSADLAGHLPYCAHHTRQSFARAS